MAGYLDATNKTFFATIGGKIMLVTGVDDPVRGNPEPWKVKNGENVLPRIVLVHNLDCLGANYPSFGLGMGGHTHGGEINLTDERWGYWLGGRLFLRLIGEFSNHNDQKEKFEIYRRHSVFYTSSGLGSNLKRRINAEKPGATLLILKKG
jgi:predicted MPP superfamily phosphohydrolase